VEHYNNVRLNSAIGYITPKDMLAGRQQEIHKERDRKLEAAREQRKNRRQRVAWLMKQITSGWPTTRQAISALPALVLSLAPARRVSLIRTKRTRQQPGLHISCRFCRLWRRSRTAPQTRPGWRWR